MILRNSAILAFFSIVSLILGIFRDRLLAQIVGVGPMLDVYNASFRIPDLVYGILLSAVSAVTVVPFITKSARENEGELARKFNSLFFFFGLTLSLCSLVAALIVPYIAHKVVPGFSEYQLEYFILTTRILLLQPLFLGLSALISSLAQVKHRFVLYSVAPLAYTLVIIASIPFLYPTFGVAGIVFGVVVGAVLSLTIQSYSLYEARMRLSWSLFEWKYVVEHMRVAIPRSLSTVVSKIRDIIIASVATSLGVGVLSIYVFAQRISDAFVQVVVQSTATAALPLLAHKHADGEHEAFTNILKTNILAILGISAVVAVGVVFFRDSIVYVLYGATPYSEQIARMAKYFAYTLPIYALNFYLASAFTATKDTMMLFYANIISTTLAVTVLFVARANDQGIFSLVLSAWTLSVSYFILLSFFYFKKRSYH